MNLETERNEQLRYTQLSTELTRFNAVQISNTIRNLRYKLVTSTQIVESNNQQTSRLSKLLEEAELEIEKLDAEKSRFIQQVDTANRAKAQVAMRISGIVHEAERTRAMLNESERRMTDIERRMPSIHKSKQAAVQRIESLCSEVDRLKKEMEQKDTVVPNLKIKLDAINSEIEMITVKVR